MKNLQNSFFSVAAVALTAVLLISSSPNYCVADDDFKPQIVINKKYPAIKSVDVKSISDADQLLLNEELVIGVEIDGQARAYPINMLTGPSREIINDNLGKNAIAATW